jgi:hypothetical protein
VTGRCEHQGLSAWRSCMGFLQRGTWRQTSRSFLVTEEGTATFPAVMNHTFLAVTASTSPRGLFCGQSSCWHFLWVLPYFTIYNLFFPVLAFYWIQRWHFFITSSCTTRRYEIIQWCLLRLQRNRHWFISESIGRGFGWIQNINSSNTKATEWYHKCTWIFHQSDEPLILIVM